MSAGWSAATRKGPKSEHGERLVALDPQTVRALRAHQDRRRARLGGWNDTLAEDAYLFSVDEAGRHPDRGTDRDSLTAGRIAVAVEGDATAVRPQLPAPDRTATGSNGSGPKRDSRARVRELVAQERVSGIRFPARDVAAAAEISERRAYELLRTLRTED